MKRMRFLDKKFYKRQILSVPSQGVTKFSMTRIAHCTREDLHQSRSFLMEIFGKLEKILAGVKDDEEVA